MNTVKRNLYLIIIGLFAGFLTNCQNPQRQVVQSESPDKLTGTWTMIKESGGKYALMDCGDGSETIELTADSVLHKGIMEETGSKIDHRARSGDSTAIYLDKAGTSYYKLVKPDMQTGISKWLIKEGDGPEIEKFFVDKAHLATIKKSKGTASDCGTNLSAGDPVDDSLVIGNGSLTASIEGGNCISIRDKSGNMQFERCLDEGNIIELRKVKGDFLPLTFMSGPHSMDADFFLRGKEWTTKSITFYRHTESGDVKTTKAMDVSLRDFDFGSVAESFE
ncbi:hypothetical protein FMM05_00165 [Flavobacterium zepuense]|uniref:Lipocalin-like domain-containing protein n=1 Tax=Flavobacterium zepuense TaxID=2593302 RepID=A0A552V9F8_9FLAO|nr:hypothetical protein [Flavobacterium zepuense]TRW27100.1 hypothetical protein FMM05_00165 [Flavobacterium zepuense]